MGLKGNLRQTAAVEHERLTSLINSMADGVIATDRGGTILICNGAALNILDINTNIVGRQLKDVLKLVDKQDKAVNVGGLITQTQTPTHWRDFRLTYEDKSTINLYLSIAPVQLGYGQRGMRGYVILMRDITHEKSLEEERDEFISVTSHELRTPIAIAEGNISNAQLVFDKGGDPEIVKKALRQAHDQILFLGGLINDLSTLARAERGKLQVTVEDINIPDLVQSLEHNYAPEAEKKGLEFKVQVDPQVDVLKSTELYVREILQNFITNAIKYTEKGSVSLGVMANDNGCRFIIGDTGIGISQADQEKIFDKFFRSEDYRTRASSGTGLGLYVTIKLARLIKAEIVVKSELNRGSTFTVSIPSLQPGS